MPEIATTTPPAPTEHTCWLPRSVRSPGIARQQLRAFLSGLPGGELLLPTGELLLSELVTNAVRHAAVPRGRLLYLRLQLAGGLLRIEVHDASTTPPAALPRPAAHAESGRGLHLVRELAVQWGWSPRPGGVGKFVWCHVAAESAP
ncbi:ATP-binding protein [Kitasatospora sp. NPDC004240]